MMMNKKNRNNIFCCSSLMFNYLAAVCLIKVKFLLNRLTLFFAGMDLISNFAASKGTK